MLISLCKFFCHPIQRVISYLLSYSTLLKVKFIILEDGGQSTSVSVKNGKQRNEFMLFGF